MREQISTSPVSGIGYSIPDTNDSDSITSFVESNKSKKTVAVQGLGFVGTAMALVVANCDEGKYAVIGVDQSTKDAYWKIGDINNGVVPIVSSDPLVEQYYKQARRNKTILATHDTSAFSHADVIIVDINLDVRKEQDANKNLIAYDVPLESFKDAIRSLAKFCRPDVLILVETTVPPGTCKKIVKPIVDDEFKKRGLSSNKISIGHSYERVMPSPNYINSIRNFYRVYSGIDKKSADTVELFLKSVISTDEYPLTRLENTESTEMAKVLENSYRAMNISFAIEWSRFAEMAGVNLFEVVDAIRQRPTHANLMYPGIGVGGYCLTKDPLLASWASENFFGLSGGLGSSVEAVERNDKMPGFCFTFVEGILSKLATNNPSIGLLGVAYGPGVGDTRFSPVENFYILMRERYDKVALHDPYVSKWRELNLDVESSFQDFIKRDLDVLILTTGHQHYIENDNLYNKVASLPRVPVIIDTVGLLDFEKLPAEYRWNQNFFVLGVGEQQE